MSLAGFQQALSALVMSPALRAEVAALPEPMLPARLEGLELTERERRRLHALARDAGMKVTTLLHRSNRLSMLTNTLPRTSEAMTAPRLQPLVQRYWQEHAPTSQQYVREAKRFVAFLRGLLRTGELVHAPLSELMEAELALLELGKSAVALPPEGAEPPPEGQALEAARPRLAPWCRVVPFRLEPRMLLKALDAPLPETLPEEERYLLLFSARPGEVEPRSLERMWGRALRASTGEASVGQVCEALGCAPPLFGELARERLVTLAPGL